MTPRPYDRTKRKAASDAVRQRIVRAIVKLHAKYGIRATTHAMIAKTADVSIPTVYNHFRTRSEVVLACGSHLATLVRPAGEDLLENNPTLSERLARLVHGLFEGYSILSPWLRWGRAESEAVPELRSSWDQRRARRLELIRKAFAPEFGTLPPDDLVASADVLLDFPAWDSLVRHHGRSSRSAEALVIEILLSLVERPRRPKGS